MEDVRTAALVSLIAIAPLAIVIVIALLRGYTLDVHLTRFNKKKRDDE